MSDPNLAPGARLKAEREQRGMSIEKAAKDMHLDTSVIEALEAGEYERVGPSVYAKGHLKRYATLLGLPVHEILADFEPVQSAAPQPERSNYPVGSKYTREPSRVVSPAQAAASLAAALALIAIMVWQPWRHHEQASVPKGASAASSVADLAAPASALDSDDLDGSAELSADNDAQRALAGSGSGGGVATSGAPASHATMRALPAPNAKGSGAKAIDQKGPEAKGVLTKVIDTPKPGDAKAAEIKTSDAKLSVASAAPAQKAHLRLSFTSDSWVDVRDALGNRAFVGNGSANTVKTIAGAAPLHVYLRSASGVQLEINGRAVAIGPQFFSGDVARFEAGADGVLRREQTAARPPG
jgi:cytoskeleton protein RodZ